MTRESKARRITADTVPGHKYRLSPLHVSDILHLTGTQDAPNTSCVCTEVSQTFGFFPVSVHEISK